MFIHELRPKRLVLRHVVSETERRRLTHWHFEFCGNRTPDVVPNQGVAIHDVISFVGCDLVCRRKLSHARNQATVTSAVDITPTARKA